MERQLVGIVRAAQLQLVQCLAILRARQRDVRDAAAGALLDAANRPSAGEGARVRERALGEPPHALRGMGLRRTDACRVYRRVRLAEEVALYGCSRPFQSRTVQPLVGFSRILLPFVLKSVSLHV